MTNKVFEIVGFEDDSIGQGWSLYYRGEYIATGGFIWQLRAWARECWKKEG